MSSPGPSCSNLKARQRKGEGFCASPYVPPTNWTRSTTRVTISASLTPKQSAFQKYESIMRSRTGFSIMVAGLSPLGARGPPEPRSSRKRFSSAR